MDEFLLQFDGLHRRELHDRLYGGGVDGDIDLVVLTSAGGQVHFRGQGDGDRGSGGLLYLEAAGAVEDRRLQVEAVFQPIVQLDGCAVVGFECLARLRGEDGKLVGVDAAHPVTGIGPAMAREAVALINSQTDAGWFVNLNLSARELGDADAVRNIASIIGQSGCPQKRIRVELTEQAALRDRLSARAGLDEIRQAGAGVILDDFGAGHSSMMWLSELDVDGVKLDAGLLQRLDTSRGRLIVRRLISLLNELGAEVVLEGIEDDSVVPVLLELGGTLGQGFAFGQPVPADQIDVAGRGR